MSFSRRDFLKGGLIGLGGLYLAKDAGRLLAADSAAPAPPGAATSSPAATAAAQSAKSAAQAAATAANTAASSASAAGKPRPKSRVCEINEPKLIDAFGNISTDEYLAPVLGRLLRELTGADRARKPWRKLFSPNDIIAIKFDPVATDELRISTPMARVILDSLAEEGFSSEKIMLLEISRHVWAGQTRNVPLGFQDKTVQIGNRQTHFARSLAEATAILSVSFIKDDRQLGLSGSMTNLGLGLISNPGVFREGGGDPGVAELLACDEIRKKHRLTIVNAIRVIYDGGPRGEEAKVWNQHAILASTDIVAADRVALDILDTARASSGLKSEADTGRPARYLKTAGKMGLGEAELNNIERLLVSV